MVDLERREVVDILQDRSADSTAGWLGGRLAVELVSRDRCGLYAHGAARGARALRRRPIRQLALLLRDVVATFGVGLEGTAGIRVQNWVAPSTPSCPSAKYPIRAPTPPEPYHRLGRDR
jgi:hypothetical protein